MDRRGRSRYGRACSIPGGPDAKDAAIVNPTLESLSDKLDSLARECDGLRQQARVLKRVVGLALLGAVALVAGGALRVEDPRTIEAERFLVKDKDGRVHAALGLSFDPATNEEFPELIFRDQKGKLRVELAFGPGGMPGLTLRDEDERARLVLGSLPDGSAQMHFYEKAGWGQLSVGAWPDGSGIKLLGPDGRGGGGSDHGGLIVAKDGSAKLHFFTPGPVRGDLGFERVNLGVAPDGKPSMTLNGENFRPVFRAP